MLRLALWIAWMLMTAGIGLRMSLSLPTEKSAGDAARVFLPGETTHGHYQIEIKCSACHEPRGGVREQSCLGCHAQELKQAKDTHPRSKFDDPTKAHLLQSVDAQSCVACHREHVPDRTHSMGLTLPGDYCFHCHQTIAEDRPSHQRFAFDTCATAGCHNYHDNTALYENFLVKHSADPPLRTPAQITGPTIPGTTDASDAQLSRVLSAFDHDAPPAAARNPALVSDWIASAHARAGVNCSACHGGSDGTAPGWSEDVDHENCRKCHEAELNGFLAGRHGMRLSLGLPPMSPEQARQPMRHDALHRSLTCNACHPAHRYDTRTAAVESCLECHNDQHSLAYRDSVHDRLWREEMAGDAPAGTGVSCATCHLPRRQTGSRVIAEHNQNGNLRPNEKMIRNVCLHCHGLGFSIDSLADRTLIEACFQGQPRQHVPSIDMARQWFDEREQRRRQRSQSGTDSPSAGEER